MWPQGDRLGHRVSVSADSIAEVIDGDHHFSVAKKGAEQKPIDPPVCMVAQTQGNADGSSQRGEQVWALAGAEELRTAQTLKRPRSIAAGHGTADDIKQTLHGHQRGGAGKGQVVVL